MQQYPALPKISVIVPVRNGQDYLENCIDSILAQTLPPMEIILINDGSTDRTEEICAGLARTHENIVAITIGNFGVSAGRNEGLERMRGDYVTFVDADDRLHPEMLSELYRNLTRTGSDVSGCRFFSWQTKQEWEEKKAAVPAHGSAGESLRTFSRKEFLLEGILKNDTRCWSKLYRRECVQTVRFREGLTIGEDMLFLIDLLPHIKSVVSTDFPGYGYFQNSQGAMLRRFWPGDMDQVACWKLAEKALATWMDGADDTAREKREKQKAQEKPEALTLPERAFVRETIAARLMMGIMLTVGKLAKLPEEERRANRQYVESCHRQLRECLTAGTGLAKLDRGYRIKVRLFAAAPWTYMRLYGGLQRLKCRK